MIMHAHRARHRDLSGNIVISVTSLQLTLDPKIKARETACVECREYIHVCNSDSHAATQ